MSVYGPDLDLANRLRQWLNPIGVQVVEIDGWQSRGRDYATFDPYGSVNHHTAGSRNGVAPSLGICINGRSRLPGPLCNVHQQRNDVVNVVAAGVANHAGRGSWHALSGNQSVFGLEIEHCGYGDEPFPSRRDDIACRVHAAFLTGLSRPDANMQCQHFEWSTEGKIDFCRDVLLGGAAGFRFRVAQLIGGSVPAPAPAPTPAPVPAPSGGPPGHILVIIIWVSLRQMQLVIPVFMVGLTMRLFDFGKLRCLIEDGIFRLMDAMVHNQRIFAVVSKQRKAFLPTVCAVRKPGVIPGPLR